MTIQCPVCGIEFNYYYQLITHHCVQDHLEVVLNQPEPEKHHVAYTRPNG